MKDNYYHKLDFKFDKRGQLVGIDYILGGLRYGTTLRSQNKKEM
jgi:hypothetical protein